MVLKYYGSVDSEDGLLLFGDAATLQLWRGSDSEETQFQRLESVVQEGRPGLNISISHELGVIWNLDGPGTVDIFGDAACNHIIMTRCWLNDSYDEDALIALSSAPANLESAFAEFEINTGYLVAFSPVESGSCIHSSDKPDYYISQEEMMTESSGWLSSIQNGRYQCFHDDVTFPQAEARRCHAIRVVTQG